MLYCYGNPLDTDAPARFAKPDFFIYGLVDTDELGLYERRLFDHLTAISIEILSQVGEAGAASGFATQARPLRHAMGESARRSNARLREAIDVLQRAGVIVEHTMRNGQKAQARFPLLSFRALEIDSPILEWDFDPRLKRAILECRTFGLVDLAHVRAFTCKWSHPLYAVLCNRKRLRRRALEVPVEQFLSLMGARRYGGNLAQVRRFVIEPALADIARHAGIHADYTLTGRGAKARILVDWVDQDALVA